MAEKVKFYKNPERKVAEKIYNQTPQYKQMGVTPVPSLRQTYDQPRGIKPPFRVETANVDTVKDNGINDFAQSNKTIDNNEYVFYDANQNAINYQMLKNKEIEKQDASNKEDFEILNSLKDDEYILFFKSEVICSGPKEEIEEQAKAIYFDSLEDVKDQDILILKKVKIKIGLFLE